MKNKIEEKYRCLFELAPLAIFHFDANGNFLAVNNKAIELTGFSNEELLSMNLSNLFSTNPGEEYAFDLDLLNRGKTIIREKEITRKNCEKICVEMNTGAMPDGSYQCIMNELTDRSKMEAALRESETRLRELNATKDKFFSIIAHDLKAPFNAIIGFSELLAVQIKSKDYDGVGKYAEIIQHSSQRAMDLLRNLLEWSRSQTGKMEFKPEQVNIIEVFNETIALLKDYSLQKTISIHRKLPDHIQAFADKDMLSTILRNLISNAIKFTEPGGEIVLSCEQKEDEIMISVKDTGIGIKEQNLEKLFRIDESHSTTGTLNEKGSGLGLILCKDFIEKHKGRIWADSKPGVGSTFYFSIPNA